jgi:hypothetical protein
MWYYETFKRLNPILCKGKGANLLRPIWYKMEEKGEEEEEEERLRW